MMSESIKVPNRWIFVIAGFIINLCLGTIYAWSVFRPPLHAPPYNLTPTQSVLPFSVFLLVFGIAFAFSGMMVGKVGPKRPALIGALCLGLGYILSSSIGIAPGAALLITLIAFGLIAGTGCGFAYNPPIAAVGRWFPDKRGLALGLTVMGFGLSAVVTAPAAVALVATVGVANAFLALGAVFFTLMFLLGWILRFPPPEWKAPPSPAVTAKRAWAPGVDFTPRQMIKTGTFYLSWLIFFIGAGAGLMVIGYTKLIAMDITGLIGELEWMATLAVAALAIANALGRPTFGKICDMIGPRSTLLIMLIIQLVTLLAIFPYATSIPVLYIAVILFGAMFGAYFAVMPTLASYFFGAKNLGPNYGLYLSAYGVGGLVLPVVMATVVGPRPTHADYVQGFHVTAAFIVVGLILALIMRPPKPPKT